MNGLRLITLSACLFPCSMTFAQAPVGMMTDPTTRLVADRCLPPCACPPTTLRSPADGGFSRRLFSEDPIFRRYAISGLQIDAEIAGRTVSIVASGLYTIGGEVANQHRLTLEAEVDGRTLRFDSGLVPVLGRRFPAIDISTTSEQFACTQYTLVLNSTPSCQADFNEDGFIDFFDYDLYVECFEGGSCRPAVSADYNLDGFVDFFDYDAFVRAFERGC